MAINQWLVTAGNNPNDPSLFTSPPTGPGLNIAQGAPGQFPQFPAWATFQNANLPPTVLAWLIMAGLLVVTLRLTLRWQG